MTFPEHADEVRIVDAVAHSPEQLPLELAAEHTAEQGFPISILDASDTTTRAFFPFCVSIGT